MADTLSPDRAQRHYRAPKPVTRTRGRAVQAIRDWLRARSDESAHQRAMEIDRRFFRKAELLHRHGRDDAIIGYVVRLLDLNAEGPVATIRTAVRAEGAAGRLQDEATERLLLELAGPAPSRAGLRHLRRRSRVQVLQLLRVEIAARRREAESVS